MSKGVDPLKVSILSRVSIVLYVWSGSNLHWSSSLRFSDLHSAQKDHLKLILHFGVVDASSSNFRIVRPSKSAVYST